MSVVMLTVGQVQCDENGEERVDKGRCYGGQSWCRGKRKEHNIFGG